jgi:hypothetical protein
MNVPINLTRDAGVPLALAYRIVYDAATGEWVLRKIATDGDIKVLAAYSTRDAAVADARRLCSKMVAEGRIARLMVYDDAGNFAFARLYER